MIEEAFVSFETAKLLKEKGFNVVCSRYYSSNGILRRTSYLLQGNSVYAPTQALVIRWLREEHKVCCDVCIYRNTENTGFAFGWLVIPLKSQGHYQASRYESYEEAEEAAIKYCLENLI